jgi:toxin ParE1/3/4
MFDYIASEDVDAAVRLRDRIRRATRNLVDHPETGRMVPELGDPERCEFIVRPYRVGYLVHENEVHVLGLVHSRMTTPDFDRNA